MLSSIVSSIVPPPFIVNCVYIIAYLIILVNIFFKFLLTKSTN
nr:MAG TPA: hypothetical protein [Caudoviricetes sp.]